MGRFLIQSAETFQYLHSSPVSGDVAWTPSLVTALRHGIIDDEEQAVQMHRDHCDRTAIVIDLDAELNA